MHSVKEASVPGVTGFRAYGTMDETYGHTQHPNPNL